MMQDLHELFAVWLGLLDQGLALAVGYLSAANGPLGLLAYVPPLLLVLLSRQPLHMLLVLVLALLTVATFRLDEPALGLVLHAACYTAAVHAFVARGLRRRADLAAAQLSRLRLEVGTFLDGLDRRTRDADRMRSGSPPPQEEPVREGEAA